MSKMTDTKAVEAQYQDDRNLNIRKALHSRYSINKKGFDNWLHEQYNVKQFNQMLELGSGNGDFFERHIDDLSHTLDITLSDFSQGMVDILEDKYKNSNVKVQQVDIQNIPFEDNSFDVVVANAMLYHVPDLEAGLKEVKRILKPNGVFYTSTFGENGLFEYIASSMNTIFNKDIGKQINRSFTMENGKTKLEKYFGQVERRDYADGLKVTVAEDLVDYIASMTSVIEIENFDKGVALTYFEDIIKEKGSIDIKKSYGMFKATL